jgi:hypothetical protein
MAKLFAMEELDTEMTDAVELEVTPQEGEVADVQVEVEQEVTETGDDTSAIEEGMAAADQLEQVEEVVAGAVEEGEGLDPVAAEAIRIAVEAICARVGANPKAVYALYATENFQSSSSRKANTKIALEGVGEFLKDMWKKIKAALTRLWTKAKEFFAKHVSSLGRVKKALESMKQKVAQSTGKVKDKAYIEEAPSSLADAFVGKADVSVATIKEYLAAHTAAAKTSNDVGSNGEQAAKVGLEAAKGKVAASLDKLTGVYLLGTEAAPLVGGVFIKYEVKSEEEELTVEVERQNIDKETKPGLSISEKGEVVKLLTDMLSTINDDIKFKAAFDKREAEFTKTMVDIEKEINASVTDKDSAEAAKEVRKAMKVVYKANAKVPSIYAELMSLDIKLAKAVLGYASVCVKNYK